MTDTSTSQMIGRSVAATKPDYRDIDPGQIAKLIRKCVGADVSLENVRGGGANAGASSGVVVFDARIRDELRPLVLRYAPLRNAGRIFVEYSIPEQAELQARLAGDGLPVPMTRWVDPFGATLSLPGFVMDKIPGDVPHASPFAAGLIGGASDEVRQQRIDAMFAAQGKVHRVDWQRLRLQPFVRGAAGRTSVESYVNWFWKTLEWIRPEPAVIERFGRVRKRLVDNQPDEHVDDLALIHGDPSLGNYMFDDRQVSAVIDWELSGILNPAYDVAMQCLSNAYYRTVSPSEVATRIPADAEWVARYELVTGLRVRHFEFYRKVATCALLVVQHSMARNIPEADRSAYFAAIEAIWAIAERD